MKKIYLLLLTLLVSMTTVMAADYYIHRDENGWNVDTSKDKFEYLSSAVTIDNVEYHYKLTFNQYSSIPSGPFKISEGTG